MVQGATDQSIELVSAVKNLRRLSMGRSQARLDQYTEPIIITSTNSRARGQRRESIGETAMFDGNSRNEDTAAGVAWRQESDDVGARRLIEGTGEVIGG